MNLQIKVYKPDYGVILKNYLDPKNWEEMIDVEDIDLEDYV